MTDEAGKPLEIVTLPMPAPLVYRGQRLPAPSPTDKHCFSGAAVDRLEVLTPQDIPGLRDRLLFVGFHDSSLCRWR